MTVDNGFMVGGVALDRTTQAWVRATGREVLLDAHPWLLGPTGDSRSIGDGWLAREAARLGGELREGGGLLGSFALLAAEGFCPERLSAEIIDFYEQTTAWRLDVWSQWAPLALPVGWLLSALFSRRLRQFALPLRSLDTAQGMDSRVVTVRGAAGEQLGAAWQRTLRATGQVVYSGWYGVAQLPGAESPSIRVVFPLPNGSVTIFLQPSVGDGGSLILTSPIGAFGDNGAYLIVREASNRAAVRRIPLAERFCVYVDDEGTLRTDHALDLWNLSALRLHYRMERAGARPRSTTAA